MKQSVLVLSLLLLSAAPAWAAKPESGTGYFPWDTCSDGNIVPLYDCGNDLFICEMAEINWLWKQFRNGSGDPVRYWERQQLEGGLYELGNTDNFLPYTPLSLTYSYDFLGDEVTVTGIWAMINIPGYGQILHDVGRLVAESGLGGPRIFEAGEHQYFDQEFEAVCDYMASQ